MGAHPSSVFNDVEHLKRLGFDGFVSVFALHANPQFPPDEAEVYLVLTPENFTVQFADVGTGGFFKGKNPNRDVDVLSDNRVDGARVIYIGQAGGGA